jgi:hypothetical protein
MRVRRLGILMLLVMLVQTAGCSSIAQMQGRLTAEQAHRTLVADQRALAGKGGMWATLIAHREDTDAGYEAAARNYLEKHMVGTTISADYVSNFQRGHHPSMVARGPYSQSMEDLSGAISYDVDVTLGSADRIDKQVNGNSYVMTVIVRGKPDFSKTLVFKRVDDHWLIDNETEAFPAQK